MANVVTSKGFAALHKQLVSPAYRSVLVLGKALAGGFRGLVQAGVIYALAMVMHLPPTYGPLSVSAVLGIVVLGSALFSTFSLIIACIVLTRERFMGIGQVLTMPIFFASSAIYPLDLMPQCLRVVARFNPLTYLVDALRALIVLGSGTAALPVDMLVMAGVFALLLGLSVRVYPGLVR